MNSNKNKNTYCIDFYMDVTGSSSVAKYYIKNERTRQRISGFYPNFETAEKILKSIRRTLKLGGTIKSVPGLPGSSTVYELIDELKDKVNEEE